MELFWGNSKWEMLSRERWGGGQMFDSAVPMKIARGASPKYANQMKAGKMPTLV